jgi:hypothetical protein|tara:strand:- start:83 stop:529 length:447 start_codon:yes stop_codon:yes gene_type:complete
MWILYLLPSWYTHAVPALGLALILVSMFLKVIPFISTYYIPLRIIGLVTLLFGIFFEGVMYSGKDLHDKIKELEAKVAAAEAKSAEVNTKIVEKIVTKQKIVKERGADIIKYVDKEIIKYDVKFAPGGQCEIPKEFISIHNKAAEEIK